MQFYVENSINILNDVTEKLNNLNSLGIYLSNQTDFNALKTLKLIILASEAKKLNKQFDINFISTTTENNYSNYKSKETIFTNLALNPQNFALELVEYIIKNYPVDLSFQCWGIYNILEYWSRSFERMEYAAEDIFYKRYDMIDKKLDILEFALKRNLLTKEQIMELVSTYSRCITDKNNFTKEQLKRMQYIVSWVEQINKFHRKIYLRKDLSREEKKKIHDTVYEIMGISIRSEIYNSKEKAKHELESYKMENDQCSYILTTIPSLIRKKVIK